MSGVNNSNNPYMLQSKVVNFKGWPTFFPYVYSSDVFCCSVREWVDSGDYKTWETLIEIGWFKHWHAILLGKANGFPLSTLHCFLWRKEHFLHFLLSEIKLVKCTSQIFCVCVCVYFQGKIEILQKTNYSFKNHYFNVKIMVRSSFPIIIGQLW